MKPRTQCLFIAAAICIETCSAHAGDETSFYVSRRRVEVFEVRVHPERDTTLYFPDDVVSASYPHDAGFDVERGGKAVFLRPTGRALTTALLDITCQRFQVGVLLRVVSDPDEATIVAMFRDQDIEAELNARVEAELAQKMRELAQLIDHKAQLRVARGLLQHHARERVHLVGRTDDHVVVRVKELIWVGHDVYIRFEIQNRGGRPYRLYSAVTLIDGIDRTGTVVFPESESSGLLGQVMPGERQSGIISVMNANPWSHDRATLLVSGAAQTREDVEMSFGLHR